MVFASGPFNIQQGNSAEFTVEFLDIQGIATTPSSAYMTVSYVNTSGIGINETVTLTVSNTFFTGTWSSTSAALGLATWTAICNSSVGQVATGQIRVIDREGG